MLPSLTSRRRHQTSPFEALWDMRREMDRMFNGVTQGVDTSVSGYMPADVIENDNELRFAIDVPGLDPDNISVTVENNVLTVSGERAWEYEEGKPDGEYHLFERRYGRFERSFALPQRVNAEQIDATVDNGVLTILLPKLEEAKPRKIAVKAGNGGRKITSK
jgi:HSP20 family protein